MIHIDESSQTFQKETISYLFDRLLESFVKDPIQRKKNFAELLDFIDSKKLYSVDDLLSQIDQISKQFSVPKNIVDDFIRKNYFKATQIIKKQKELLNLFLKNDTNCLKVLSREVFNHDFSNAKFVFNQTYYVIKFPDKTISEKNSNSSVVETLHISTLQKKEQPKKQDQSSVEEVSILKEILSLYPDIEKTSKDALKNIQMYHSLETSQENQRISVKEKTSKPVFFKEELSILKEILDEFGRLLVEKKNRIEQLQLLLMKEESNYKVSFSYEASSVETIQQTNIEKIPMEITEYVQLKIKLQNFKKNNQIKEYQDFLNRSSKHIKACVGILNIITKETQFQNFQKEEAFKKLSNTLQYSYESIFELYDRIKKFNTYIHFLQQAAQYLKEKEPKLYTLFVQIQKPLLELMEVMLNDSEINEDEFKNELEKKIKILLLFIKEENISANLKNFLINFILKSKNALMK